HARVERPFFPILMRQLPLEISPPAEPSFDNFVPGQNVEALARVRELALGTLREAIVYLWGEAGSGRTHLLRAAARANASLVIAAYLLARVPRDMATLTALLDALDREALTRKRPLTLPLVREVLGASNERGGTPRQTPGA